MSTKLWWAFVSGLLIALPFIFPVLFPLAWISLIPLLWALRECTLRQGFLFGWLAGMAAHLFGFYWVDHTVRVFGGIPYGLSELVLLLFAAASGLSVALFSLLMRLCGLGLLHLFPALFWVTIEFWFPYLFPWHLANSQAEFLLFIQTADLVGPYGTSFLLVWCNALIYSALFKTENGIRAYVAPAIGLSVLVIASLLYGQLRLKGVDEEIRAARTLRVGAVQGSIDIQFKWDTALLEKNLKSYRDLTKEISDANLVIWPETAIEHWLPEHIGRVRAELLPALGAETSFIFGARSFRGTPEAHNLKVFNSAFLTDDVGRVFGHYHKQVLLAFGEYIPFAALLSKLPGMPPVGDGFTPGEGPRTLDLPTGVKVAPLICYEDIMPGLARRFIAEQGADLLVNLTNDAWFGDTVAPWQHARLSQWRAIETRRYLVRVTNTGLTTIIDPKGEMLKSLPTFSSGVLTADVAVLDGKTLYVRFGDWFAWLITFCSLAIVLWRLYPYRRFFRHR